MTDKEYWSLADEYEEINKDENSYVPRENWKALAADVCQANNHSYDESLADLTLFRYGRKLSEQVPKVCLNILAKLCKEE